MAQPVIQQLKSIIDRTETLIEHLLNNQSFEEGQQLVGPGGNDVKYNGPQNMTIELEVRLGHWNPETGKFTAGVSRFFMEKTLSLLQSFAAWDRVVNWVEMQDFFYKDLKGQTIRTSVMYNEETQQIETRHLIKKNFEQHTIAVDGSENPDIRVAVSVEQEVNSNVVPIPEIVTPEFVRIKQRKSFIYTPPDFQEPIWRFDLTMSWCGVTKAEAEQKQRTEAPIYEIECECLSPLNYRVQRQYDQESVAKSLLLKVLDFYCPPTDPPSFPNAYTLLSSCLRIAK